jgi:hypothetical protein
MIYLATALIVGTLVRMFLIGTPIALGARAWRARAAAPRRMAI